MADQSRGNQGGNQGNRGNASNIPHEAKVKGGEHSAAQQDRDNQGQFAGKTGGSSANRGSSGGGKAGGGNQGRDGNND